MPTLNNGLASSLWRDRINTWSALFNGGTVGQVLAKDSSTDDAYTWQSILSAMDAAGEYETGTWTPAVTVGGTTGTITHSSQSGWYQVLNDQCFIAGRVLLSAFSGNTGEVRISGLPFTADSNFGYRAPIQLAEMRGLTYTGQVAAMIEDSTTYMVLTADASGSSSSTLDASTDVASNARAFFAGCYKIA